MAEYTIWAIKAPSGDAALCAELKESLKAGVARFGWSYIPDTDLMKLQKKITTDGWDSLNEKEKDCYQPFLLDVKPDDWWVYINVPTYSMCCAARGSYKWLGQYPDFNHSVSVDPSSFFEFHRRDAAVPAYLQARLVLPSRKWRVNAQTEFEQLVAAAQSHRLGRLANLVTDLNALTARLEPLLEQIAILIQASYPNRNLELLIKQIFERIPGTQVTHQGGAGDHGADIIVEYDNWFTMQGLLPRKQCLVQVKSYEGTMSDRRAVDDIKRAFEQYPEADMGLIISTAKDRSPSIDEALDQLRETLKKPVGLLIGRDLARFVLRYGHDLIFAAERN